VKTASLCIPSFWHNTGVWRTDIQTDGWICISIYSACTARFAVHCKNEWFSTIYPRYPQRHQCYIVAFHSVDLKWQLHFARQITPHSVSDVPFKLANCACSICFWNIQRCAVFHMHRCKWRRCKLQYDAWGAACYVAWPITISALCHLYIQWCRGEHFAGLSLHTFKDVIDCLMLLSSAGSGFHVSWSDVLYVCVWMLTRVAQIITAARRDLRTDLLMNLDHTPKTRSVWPTLWVKTARQNSGRVAASWASQSMGCLFYFFIILQLLVVCGTEMKYRLMALVHLLVIVVFIQPASIFLSQVLWHSPPLYKTISMMTVWRIRGEIIRTVLCCIA